MALVLPILHRAEAGQIMTSLTWQLTKKQWDWPLDDVKEIKTPWSTHRKLYVLTINHRYEKLLQIGAG